MKQRQLGNTGLHVSRLCFGTLTVGPCQANLPLEAGAAVLAHGIEQGVNFFDTAQLYETYPYLRRAMEVSGHQDIVISSKTYAYTRELAVEAVEQARRELDRDYIDIFMLHEQESIHTLRGHAPALDYLFECKQKGIVRAVGASMHHIAAVYGACEIGLDCIHPLINVQGLGIVDGSRQEMEQALQQAHSQGIGIFGMKPLGGGNLFSTAEHCLDYALSLPYLDSIAIGMQSADEVDANIAYWESGRFSPQQKLVLSQKTRRLHIDDWCEACGNCVDKCSQGALSVPEDIAVCEHSKCILCGYCSRHCPAWAIKIV